MGDNIPSWTRQQNENDPARKASYRFQQAKRILTARSCTTGRIVFIAMSAVSVNTDTTSRPETNSPLQADYKPANMLQQY